MNSYMIITEGKVSYMNDGIGFYTHSGNDPLDAVAQLEYWLGRKQNVREV